MRKLLIGSVALMLSVASAQACNSLIGMNIADGVASKFGLAQLWNPAGSGKNLVVSSVEVAVTSWGATPAGTRAADIIVRTAALPNLTGKGQCKTIGDASLGVGELRWDQVLTSSMTGVGPFYEFWMGGRKEIYDPTIPAMRLDIGTSEFDKKYTFSPPLIILPGNGIAVRGAQPAMYVVTSWQWDEVVQ